MMPLSSSLKRASRLQFTPFLSNSYRLLSTTQGTPQPFPSSSTSTNSTATDSEKILDMANSFTSGEKGTETGSYSVKSHSKQALDEETKKLIERFIRVDQAGELGADWIYRGQMAVLQNTSMGPIIKHMWDQEKHHLEKFNSLALTHRVRPTVLDPIWRVIAFGLGASTALMGKETAMACTEAVETVIGEHYNDQIRKLIEINDPSHDELKEIIKKFRDEELEHLNIAIDLDAQKAPMHSALTSFIQTGCKAAIWLSSRI